MNEIKNLCEELKLVRDEIRLEFLIEGFSERWEELHKHESDIEFDIVFVAMKEYGE